MGLKGRTITRAGSGRRMQVLAVKKVGCGTNVSLGICLAGARQRATAAVQSGETLCKCSLTAAPWKRRISTRARR